ELLELHSLVPDGHFEQDNDDTIEDTFFYLKIIDSAKMKKIEKLYGLAENYHWLKISTLKNSKSSYWCKVFKILSRYGAENK
ncbi:MAG: hypothetical protein MHPSP_003359, partial [Paramarteilia canceri]